MKSKKRFFTMSLFLVLTLVLAGCTPNQKAIFDASMKMQNVNSVQEHITMSMDLSGTGLDPELQEQVDQVAAMLNEAQIQLNLKTNTNDDKTIIQSEVDMDLRMPGMEMSMPYWIDMDLAGDNPKFIEIFQMPLMAKASLPPEYMNKDYMVMDLTDNSNPELSTMDMTKLMDFSMKFQTKWTDFLNSYANRFNPEIEVIKVPDQDNSIQKYTISLDDKKFKELLNYTVNSFAQDEEALDFMKEYFQTILDLSGGTLSEGTAPSEDLMDVDKLNTVLESLKDVTLIGESGIKLEYTISDGYIVQNSGSIALQFDLSQIMTLMNIPSEAEGTGEVSGVLNLAINYNTDISNINQPVDIRIPELSSENSFDYFDFIEASLSSLEETVIEPMPEPVPEPGPSAPLSKDYTVQPGDTLATIALNHYGSYEQHADIYQANLAVFKKSNNRLDAGMVLNLPAKGLLAPLPAENVKQVYTVKAGDTLGTIAKQIYGDSSLYTKIYEANKERLKSPNLIFEGQKLVIPN